MRGFTFAVREALRGQCRNVWFGEKLRLVDVSYFQVSALMSFRGGHFLGYHYHRFNQLFQL